MTEVDDLAAALGDLSAAVHQLAEQLQRLIVHVEGQTTALPYRNEVPLVLSELSELHNRLQKLTAGKATP